ncbi:hypothetical protein [Azospirillum rugosum]|uniref:Uncharacterized protein n=1 Tax=Azospirillum rugosum TaxID=416170 RepID=A0ABS4SGE8_9PROT|nr:hypothetical protein [Azospirillum rugosum]MBP2291274.1 hypothetical protein [Azospirillum rugosum]MDQ0525062.1 hypothetical protein [Azospirillum rugosum]
MVRISLRGISVTEAESALAKLWCRVEELDAAPPRLRFRFLPDGRISVLACFPDPDTARRVVQALGWPAGPHSAQPRARTAANPPEEPATQF